MPSWLLSGSQKTKLPGAGVGIWNRKGDISISKILKHKDNFKGFLPEIITKLIQSETEGEESEKENWEYFC